MHLSPILRSKTGCWVTGIWWGYWNLISIIPAFPDLVRLSCYPEAAWLPGDKVAWRQVLTAKVGCYHTSNSKVWLLGIIVLKWWEVRYTTHKVWLHVSRLALKLKGPHLVAFGSVFPGPCPASAPLFMGLPSWPGWRVQIVSTHNSLLTLSTRLLQWCVVNVQTIIVKVMCLL